MQENNNIYLSDEELGKNIVIARKKKNLSQKELAKILNTNNQVVCRWEKGIRRPTDQTKVLLADTLGISVQELCYGRLVNGKK